MKEIQESDNQILTPLQQKKEAFFVTLHTLVCYKTRMCLTKINFDSIQKLSKPEHNMFLLGIVHTITCSKNTILCSKEKQYLTTKYIFDNDEFVK
ncbi:17676_t:CDS:2 [Gigaspora margarita]|uniref:17676_t:CDS:1 n=1 Tax=Gigaspora margarita TaxID=4874 RepID=A0ABN7V4W4_GIGMA|nr:17676_t:CDS:2 [Gigaspora margarita]